MYVAQIQARKNMLCIDHADHMAPTRRHELHHTDQEYRVSALPGRSRSCRSYRSYRSYKSYYRSSVRRVKYFILLAMNFLCLVHTYTYESNINTYDTWYICAMPGSFVTTAVELVCAPLIVLYKLASSSNRAKNEHGND